MRIVILGLSITSSWGNGHATTFAVWCEAWRNAGMMSFFWNATSHGTRKIAISRGLRLEKRCLYSSLTELKDRWAREIRNADFVIVGSYVPQGVAVGEWVTSAATGPVAFYDIDTPVTLSKLDLAIPSTCRDRS